MADFGGVDSMPASIRNISNKNIRVRQFQAYDFTAAVATGQTEVMTMAAERLSLQTRANGGLQRGEK
jgi:hypothetical protein